MNPHTLNYMLPKWAMVMACLCGIAAAALGQQAEPIMPRNMNLNQAVELALKHNHVVRIASFKVEEEEHAREVARSAYFPVLRNDSTFVHVTDTQNIEIPVGGLGIVGNSAIPQQPLVINQGGKTFETVGTGLNQPLTQLFRIKAGNDAARADVEASRGKARSVQNQIALKVRQIYYKILVVQSQHRAIEAKVRALQDLQTERVQQVRYGSTLEADLIESRAQSLEARQALLTSELQLSDLRMQFNDVVGLPIKTDKKAARVIRTSILISQWARSSRDSIREGAPAKK